MVHIVNVQQRDRFRLVNRRGLIIGVLLISLAALIGWPLSRALDPDSVWFDSRTAKIIYMHTGLGGKTVRREEATDMSKFLEMTRDNKIPSATGGLVFLARGHHETGFAEIPSEADRLLSILRQTKRKTVSDITVVEEFLEAVASRDRQRYKNVVDKALKALRSQKSQVSETER